MKNHNLKLKTFYFFFVVFIFSFSVFHFASKNAQAATLYLLPQSHEGSQDSTFLVEVRLMTDGDTVNTVEAHVAFPSDVLEARDVSMGGSILELIVEEPKIQQGSVSFLGGIPAGFQGDGKIASVTFGWKKAGEATVTFAPESRVLLHDGRATPAALELMDAGYTARAQVAESEAPRVSAQFHADEDAWYRRDEVYLNWQVKSGAQYSYLISRTPLEQADEIPEEAVGEGSIKYEDLGEGIFYFSLREKPAGAKEFGPPTVRRIMIDRTAPAVFTPNFATIEGKQYLVFSTTDNLSGIAQYEVWERPAPNIWQQIVQKASAQEQWKPARTPYLLEHQNIRGIIISVRAVDKAGNTTTAEVARPRAQFSQDDLVMFVLAGGGLFIILLAGAYIRRRKKP